MKKSYYNVNNEPIVVSKVTFDILLKQEKPADVLALYLFYYMTAKWQNQRDAYCTTGYTASGLKWTEERVIRTKKELIRLKLIENVVKTDEKGKITGHFIKVNFKWVDEDFFPADHPPEKPGGGLNQGVVLSGTNTTILLNEIQPNLKVKNKKKNIKKEKFVTNEKFKELWSLYHKGSKADALKAWIKVCQLPIKSEKVSRPKWKKIKQTIKASIKSERWQKQPEYIPNTSTWLNGYRWLDDTKDLKVINFDKPKRTNNVGYHGGYKVTKQAIEM